MRDPLSQVPVRYKLPLTYALLCVLTLGLAGIVVTTTRDAVVRQIRLRLDDQAAKTHRLIDGELERLGRRVEGLAADEHFRRELERLQLPGEGAAAAGRRAAAVELMRHLRDTELRLAAGLVDTYLLDAAGNVLLGAGSAAAAVPAAFNGGGPGRSYPTFTLSTPVASLDGSRRLGYLQTVIRADVWAGRLRQVLGRTPPEGMRITLSSPAGFRLQLFPGDAAPATESAEGRLEFASTNPRTGWKVGLSIDRQSLKVPLRTLSPTFLSMGLVTVALISLLYFPTWQFLLKPLAELQSAARRITEGDFSVRVGHRSGDEVGHLGAAFNVMAGAVEDRSRRLAQAAEDLRLQEGLAVLGEVAAVMAHEINNPLAAISMFSQMLLDGLDPSSPLRTHAEVVHRNTLSCARTLRSLLDLAARSSSVRQDLDVHDLVRGTVQLLHPLAERSQTVLRVDAGAADGVLHADELQLRQALVNLVLNGIHAAGKVESGEVTVATLERDRELVIRVHDSGPGIPEELREHVFEPFFTTKAPGEGTGLGLPTTRRIVEAHGGRLILCADAGKGTTFEMIFPRHEEGP